jgi:hypothetical protein
MKRIQILDLYDIIINGEIIMDLLHVSDMNVQHFHDEKQHEI